MIIKSELQNKTLGFTQLMFKTNAEQGVPQVHLSEKCIKNRPGRKFSRWVSGASEDRRVARIESFSLTRKLCFLNGLPSQPEGPGGRASPPGPQQSRQLCRDEAPGLAGVRELTAAPPEGRRAPGATLAGSPGWGRGGLRRLRSKMAPGQRARCAACLPLATLTHGAGEGTLTAAVAGPGPATAHVGRPLCGVCRGPRTCAAAKATASRARLPGSCAVGLLSAWGAAGIPRGPSAGCPAACAPRLYSQVDLHQGCLGEFGGCKVDT